MFPGGPTTSSPGDTQNKVLGLQTEVIAGNVLSATMTPWAPYRNRYWAPYINGIYLGFNVKAHFSQEISVQGTIPYNTSVGSIYFEDAGNWDSFPGNYNPAGRAEYQDALTANQIQITWVGTYELTAPTGDTQLSIASVSGASRNYNVGPVSNRSTRGRLYYTITLIGGLYVVRFWAVNGQNQLLVAQGVRSGNGVVTATPQGNSGLSVVCDLTYTGDVPANTAWFDLRWNQAFQVHYSTSPLSFPRTPEAIVQDTGVDTYIFLSPVIPGGVYNFNVLTVNDDGLVQGSAYPTTAPLTLNAAPSPPLISSVTGTAADLVVHWTTGETGCTYTVYSSLKGTPINFEAGDIPTPIITGTDATSATLAPITDFSTEDFTPDFNDMATAFDAGVASALAAYDAGETDFVANFEAAWGDIDAAINTFGSVMQIDFSEFNLLVTGLANNVLSSAGVITGLGMSLSDWQAAMNGSMGQFISNLGTILIGNAARYTFSDGSLPTGTPTLMLSIRDAAQPLIIPVQIRVIVRATKGGIQEQTDAEFIVNLDEDGSILLPKPNQANLESLTVVNGLTVNVVASVIEDNTSALASAISLFVVPIGDSFDFSAPVDTEDLGTAYGNYHRTSLSYTVVSAGWYKVAVKAVSITSEGETLSDSFSTFTTYLSNTTPDAVLDLSAKVIRGKGII